MERLSNLAFEQPDNLADAADELGLTVRESGHVSRRGEPGHEVLGDPAVIAAAFDEDVLAGNNSEPVEIEGYRTVVVRVDDRREPRQRTLDEVRPEIVAALQAERATDETRALGVDLLGPAAGWRGARGGGRRPRVERGAYRRARRSGSRCARCGRCCSACRARARAR